MAPWSVPTWRSGPNSSPGYAVRFPGNLVGFAYDFASGLLVSYLVSRTDNGIAGSGFAVALTASSNTFEDCGSVRAGVDGFLVAGSANTFTKAKAAGSGGFDLNDPAGGATTNVYTDCTFKSSNVP